MYTYCGGRAEGDAPARPAATESVPPTKGTLVSITDNAGEVILGRHPEHGFVIDGQVRADVADLLYSRGFQLNTDDVLALPTDMPEKQAREKMVRAAQVLAMTGHTVGVLSDEQSAEMVRYDEVRDILTASRDQLLARIRELHPTPDCLPVPALRIPENRPEFDQEITAVQANLWDRDGLPESDWAVVWHTCDHADGRVAVFAHGVVDRWHHLLTVCRQYLDDGCATVSYDPTSAAAQLAEELRSLTVPPRNHALEPGLVGQLDDGDEFTLDGGQTWHVCGVVLYGTVSVYTGEHDQDGEPLLVRIDADADQRCLVRRPLTK